MNSEEFHDLVPVNLKCPIVNASAEVVVMDTLPMEGVDFLLGNDMAGAKVFPSVAQSVVSAAESRISSGDGECVPEGVVADSADVECEATVAVVTGGFMNNT